MTSILILLGVWVLVAFVVALVLGWVIQRGRR